MDYTIYSIYTQKNKMQKFIHRVVKRIKRFRKDRKSNLNAFLIFVAIVMVWCGISNLIDTYFFPNQPLIGNLICIAVWLIILLLDDGKLWELEWEWETIEETKNKI